MAGPKPKRGSYMPTSKPAPRVVQGRTFKLAPPMRDGGQQPKSTPRSKTR